MEITIQTKGISKKYRSQKGRLALNDINLSVQKGSLFGLIGSDGAGKTTLLRILSTVLPASSGSATLAGLDVRKQAEDIRKILGYMPQEFSQYQDLSLQENLNFFADIQQVPKAQKKERIDQMLEFTQLTKFRDRPAGKLSGGMKKKLALACAMVHNPQVLILDEPSTGVDPVSRGEFWNILASIIKDGVTVLISTPYMDEADRCNEVGMLYEGSLLQTGKPEEITHALPFVTLEVKASPRKRMREIVDQNPRVLNWNPVGDRLRVAINSGDQDELMQNLRRQFDAEGMPVHVLRPVRKTMDDAFIDMVSSQKGA
ncbi:MAG: ABC transporter ATP-binding protein [Anaerolineaceae bacterium]|jgi:ABC-2 type transport system ATP-binding protein